MVSYTVPEGQIYDFRTRVLQSSGSDMLYEWEMIETKETGPVWQQSLVFWFFKSETNAQSPGVFNVKLVSSPDFMKSTIVPLNLKGSGASLLQNSTTLQNNNISTNITSTNLLKQKL